MKILIAKYWKQFKKRVKDKDGKYKEIKNGKEFERLIQRILDLEYGLNLWKPTKMTHDGSRDFEMRTAKTYKWAECKNYEAKISLNVISNTLVMALIDFADELLIFSYSPIKKPVLEKLIRYADVSEKKLRIYADESLEEIILKYINIFKKDFFPSFNINSIPDRLLRPFLSCSVIANPIMAYTMSYDMGEIPKSPEEINFNTILCLSIFVFNPRISSISIKMDVNWKDCDYAFEILNKDYKDKFHRIVLGNETYVEKIFFRTIKYKKILNMPKVTISCSKLEKNFIFNKVRCCWIGDCILQGSSYLTIFNSFYPNILNKRWFSAIHIYGTSGSGKSRMLAEFENIALGQGYRVIRFNEEKKNISDDFVKNMMTELICAIFDIPNLSELFQENDIDETNEIYVIVNYLKKELKLDSLEYKYILTKVLDKLKDSKCYISLDNVQYYPKRFIHFIQDILDNLLLSNNECRCRIGFAFNVDYIYYRSECETLFATLIDSKDRIKSYRIDGFKTDGEAQVYLNQLLPNSDIDDKYITRILSVTKRNPYFIKNLLVSLKSEGILIQENDEYIIPDNNHKHIIKKIGQLSNVNDNIECRWNLYIKKYNYEHSLFVIAVLHIFEKIDQELIELFSINTQILNDLCNYQFITKNIDIKIFYTFDHDLTEKFFSQKYFPLCKYALFNNMSIDNILYYNLQKLTKKKQLSFKECCEMSNFEIPYKIGYEYYTLLSDKFLEKANKNFIMEKFLGLYFSLCSKCREYYGTKAALPIYDKIVKKVTVCIPELQNSVAWAWAMISYCNVLYEFNKYNEAIECIKITLKYWESKQNDDSNILKGYFYNRLHVYERALNEEVSETSYTWLEKSESIGIANKIAELEFINYVDRGYCIYSTDENRNKFIEQWKKACELYENNSVYSKKMNYYYHKTVILLLEENYDFAIHQADIGLKAIDNREEGVYYITYFREKYILCKITCLLIEYTEDKLKKIDKLFVKVDEYNYKLQSRSSYAIQYLKSIVFFYKKKYVNAILSLQETKKILQNVQKLTFRDVFLEQIYENIQYFTAEFLNSGGNKDMLLTASISDKTIKAKISKIVKMDSQNLQKYIEQHKASSILQSKNRKVNYPVL